MHMKKEIQQCMNFSYALFFILYFANCLFVCFFSFDYLFAFFRSKDEDIDLLDVEKFYTEASKEISKPVIVTYTIEKQL